MNAAILIWQWPGENFFQVENLKFPNLSCTLRQKNAISPKVLNRFQKLSFCWKMWKIGIWDENFMNAAILILQWEGENFFPLEIWNFPI